MAKAKPKISTDEVRHIAKLARISLSDKEVTKFQKELSSILEYVDKINEVDTRNIRHRSHIDLTNILRQDTVEKSLTQDEALQNRKDRVKDGYFTIKSVLEHK